MFSVSRERKQYWLSSMQPPVVALTQCFEVAMVPPPPPPLTRAGLLLVSPESLTNVLVLLKEMKNEVVQGTLNNR